MEKEKICSKRRGYSFSRVLFTGLALGFTLISVYSQFKFYRILFSLQMAVLISSVFEITRVACLFKFQNTRGGKTTGILTVVIYTVVASVCAFGSINSFTAEIIQKSRNNDTEIQAQVHKIKQEYSRKIEGKLAEIEKEIRHIDDKMAKYPGRLYWERKLSQAVTRRDRLITERDGFLNHEPENPRIWIKAKSAMLGMKMERISRDSNDMSSVTQALGMLWGLEKEKTQVIMGIVITLTVECAILLLAYLGRAERKSRGVTEKTTDKESVTKSVTSAIDEKLFQKFIEANREYFENTGELLPMRKISVNLRPVRKAVEGMDKTGLKRLFEV
jgi:hypothetical protein